MALDYVATRQKRCQGPGISLARPGTFSQASEMETSKQAATLPDKL